MQVVISSRALIINPENKLLLVTHKDDDFYYTPGGKWNSDETLKECAEREVYEEIGLKVNLEKLIYVHEYVSDHHGTPEKFFAFFFLGRTNKDLPEKWHDEGGKAPIISRFLSRQEIKNLEKIYPKFLQDKFWEDLEDNFKNHNIYINLI